MDRVTRHKYNAKKAVVEIDGKPITFDSKAEAHRYQELVLMQRTGLISDLELQPEFVLQDGFRRNNKAHREIKYRADFRYIQDGARVVEDVKGKQTREYQIKKKMMLQQLGSDDVFRESQKISTRFKTTDF